MSIFELQAQPIDEWPGELTRGRKKAKFKASYGDTMTLLKRELDHLRAKAIVLLMALHPGEIRRDGRPYADAKPKHPGVILCFESQQGAMRYPCDAFDYWTDNLRAIALSLECLRTVDRYGVTRRGEQYTGWLRLPPPAAASDEIRNRDDVNKFLLRILGALPHGTTFEEAFRMAEVKLHPDRGGNAADFKKVQQCRDVLKGQY